jgi:hypothetical protein
MRGTKQGRSKRGKQPPSMNANERANPCFMDHSRPADTTHRAPDRLCKQEVAGSIPAGSTGELHANWPVLGLATATGHGRDQAEIKHRFWGAAGRRLSDDAGSLGLGSGSAGSRVRRGSNPRSAPHRDSDERRDG